MADIEKAVRHFLVHEYLQGEDTPELTEDTPLRESGILDSLGLVNVVVYLEREFGLEVEPSEANDENLGTIARIAAFVAHRTGRS